MILDSSDLPRDSSDLLCCSVIFGFMMDDSTAVYYRMYNGIQPPKKSLILNADEDEDD